MLANHVGRLGDDKLDELNRALLTALGLDDYVWNI
jgi:mRNA-degrading endonuclease toxin of MazEF toxin-antitoxin module